MYGCLDINLILWIWQAYLGFNAIYNKVECIHMFCNFPVKPSKKPEIPFGATSSAKSGFYTLFDNKHCGVDFLLPVGIDIYASFTGIVVRKEFHKGMGNVVGIRNGNIAALYAHLREFKVSLGDIVKSGDLVGLSGETGAACTEPHLHFELRDIIQPTLKEMVFDPPLGNEISNYKSIFMHTVNNKNTQKTLASLSKLYFGVEDYWDKIKDFNTTALSANAPLEDGKKILILNFS